MDSTKTGDAAHQQNRPCSVAAACLRWSNIAARTLHIAVAAVLFGGCVLGVPFTRLGPWHWLTIVSGGLLILLEWLQDPRWWHRGKGLFIWLHLGLSLLIHVMAGLMVPLLWLVLITGSVGSHMPRRYRHWSIREGWEKRDEH